MRRLSKSPKVFATFGLFCILLLTGCTSLSVQSSTPGARVVWSRDGLEPYRPWPPNSWEIYSKSDEGATPLKSRGVFGDVLFVTVEKDGYRRPLPQTAQLFAGRNEKLFFELEELPETRAARLTEEGFVEYKGNWVRPEEEGLEQYDGVWMPKMEAHRARQRASGLVEYDGDWLSPVEAERRMVRDMTTRGLVAFKDGWVTPEQARIGKGIDDRVASVREAKVYQDLPAPQVLGQTNIPDAALELYNSSAAAVVYLFSGPVSRSITVAPYSAVGVRRDDPLVLPPGRYDIVTLPEVDHGKAHWASWPLSAGMKYSFNFAME